ncbi:hypothetical protein Bca4012_056445 [Brassica carinata]|uniref:PHD-type domain-containing protein n=1 Tax=Brassica carinata TaxID=52824 RepID=A0A8X7VZ17_BRACI|nr:hypothetical protein Bca52824_013724 [Brassica carinata]
METLKNVFVEAELNPGSNQDWLSITQQGNKIDSGTRRYYLSIKKREMRYKSPEGNWSHSQADICLTCVDDDIHRQQQQQQIVPKSDLPCFPKNLVGRIAIRLHLKKARNKVKTCSSDSSFKTVPNIDVSNQHSAPCEIRPRTGKSLNKFLEVMEKKNQKCEKEYVRFWRKDYGPEMNYDVCCFCHRDGELLLCDGCRSSFHYTCFGLSSDPNEELWFRPCCCCDISGSIETSGNIKLMTCEQCQRRFHLKCLKNKIIFLLCTEAGYSLLGCRFAVGGNGDLVWTLLRDEDEHYADEQISKLASAIKIIHQGFEPTKDPSFRKRPYVAEIPLVATLSDYRKSEIMGVCRLVLPAAADVVTTWTHRFGFSVMEIRRAWSL